MSKDMQSRSLLLWGLIAIAVGVLFLTDYDVPPLGQLWRYWPFLFMVFGAIKLIPPTAPKHVVDGLSQIAFAGWFYVSFEHLWGLSFQNSWPILVIIGGISMVLRPFVIKYTAKKEENQ
jgi:hypothetical protein